METWIGDANVCSASRRHGDDLLTPCLTLQLAHNRLGMQTLGLMVEAEGQGFVRRLPTFLPLLHACLRRSKSSEVGVAGGVAREGLREGERKGEELGEEEEEQDGGSEGDSYGGEEERVKMTDHLLFSSLSTFRKICQQCDIISTGPAPIPAADMHAIWGEHL